MTKLSIFFLAFVFLFTAQAPAEIVQSGDYKLVTDTCYNHDTQTEAACDYSWLANIQEIQVALNYTGNPMTSSLKVTALKQTIPNQTLNGQTIPVFDTTAPMGFFSETAFASFGETSVYKNGAVVNTVVGGSKGRLQFDFEDSRLTYSAIEYGWQPGWPEKKIRTMVFEK